MGLFFVILVLECLLSFVSPDAEGDALVALKGSLNDTANQLRDWNQNQVNPCTWPKVICDTNNNVITVSLSNMGFTGTLTPKLGILKSLTTLSLQGNAITGTIPEEFGNLSSLTMLDMENNRLSGEIPASLGNLKKLQFLILNQNNLTGAIPQTLSTLPQLINLQLASNGLSGQIPGELFQTSKYNFTGNSLNCGSSFQHQCESDSGGSSSKSKAGMIAGVLAGILGAVLFGGVVMFIWKGRNSGYKREVFVDVAGIKSLCVPQCPTREQGKLRFSMVMVHPAVVVVAAFMSMAYGCVFYLRPRRSTSLSIREPMNSPLGEQYPKLSYGQLLQATNRFSPDNLIGTGRYSWVYKGILTQYEQGIAIKVIKLDQSGARISFVAECEALKHIRHRNLVKITACSGEVDRRIAFGQLKRFSWRELQLATDSFSEKNVLGQGGFGKVYKGVLADGTKIAVKRLTDYESPGGDAAFQREVEMISVAVHRNLLRLIGFCTTPTERLLVYPYMQNLSVAYRLRELKPGEAVLDWPTRKRVALGTARGLEYLHEHCNPKIIHRDVKAANVLLDQDFEAVVGDFGLAKLVDVRKTNVTTQVRGTMGHIAPEYLSTGKSSEKTDVFGYGVMLLELVTGQRAIDFSRLEEEDDVLLLDHVKKLQREKRLDAIVDKNLRNNFNIQEVEMMIQVALLCTQGSPEDRPAMSEVVRMLEGEGLAERWEEWQHVEVTRRQEYERLQRRFDWGEDSLYNQDAIELSGGR